MILLDTSVLSRVFRRKRPGAAERELQAALEALMAGDAPLGLPGIVLQEALSGIASQRQFSDLKGRLLSAFTIIAATIQDHVEATRLRNLCAGKGVNVSGIDCLIAVAAMAGGHELFAVDTDFDLIAEHAPLKLFRPRVG